MGRTESSPAPQLTAACRPQVVIGPERRSEVANASLAYMAGEGRDIASMLAIEAGVSLDLRDVDSRIQVAHAEYIPDADDES